MLKKLLKKTKRASSKTAYRYPHALVGVSKSALVSGSKEIPALHFVGMDNQPTSLDYAKAYRFIAENDELSKLADDLILIPANDADLAYFNSLSDDDVIASY